MSDPRPLEGGAGVRESVSGALDCTHDTADATPSVTQRVASPPVWSRAAALDDLDAAGLCAFWASTFDVVLGERSGFLAVAFGHDPYRDEHNRYQHRTWTERRYPWPDGREALATDVARTRAAGERTDVYACPAVRITNDRRKGSALPPMVCWADLDKPSIENVTAVTLQALASERFTPAGLFGKLANIAGDIDGTFIENTARFKAITGGDVITAEFKFRDQFEFTPRAVPIFSANKIPGSADVTVGYLSRWVVLPFPNSFAGKEDRGLDAKLSTPAELAGIARKGVKALWDLMARGNFVETESSQKAFDDFRRKVNQVESWLHECCERSPEHGHVKRTELFAAYQRWAEQDGFGKLKAPEFYDRLSAAGITAAKVHGSRGFNGIKVIDECFGDHSPAWGPPGVQSPFVSPKVTP